jgi:aryl-alcohol dehydrogenase-like predicted oxidoreductase
MKKHTLGNSGMEVPALIFGSNIFGWTTDERASFRLLDACVASGLNCIDTADVYSRWVPGNKGGESETIIGNWLTQRGNREKIVICTKVGKEMPPGKKGLSPAYIREALEASLKRLQTDYIDLYQSHDDDASTPLEDTLGTYSDLIKEGKIRVIGASNFSAARLAEAVAVSEKNGLARYESLQPLYNLFDRKSFEKELAPVCIEKNIGVISFYSLASGFLTGKYRSDKDFSKSQRGQHMQKYFTDRGFRILGALDDISKKYDATPAAISLAWLMASPGVTAPIASATSTEQLKDLVKATEIQLDSESMTILNAASA